MKFSLVQWSPKGTKLEDFKMVIIDIRLLQNKEDIRVRVSVRVKVPDVNPTLLKNHKDTSKFEITFPVKDFIKMSSGEAGEEVNNLVTKLIINDPLTVKYSPNINALSMNLNAIFKRFLSEEIESMPYLSGKGNLKGHGVITHMDKRANITINNEKPLFNSVCF